MSIVAVECMFDVVAECLNDGGKFCLYGPFNLDGKFTSDSNENAMPANNMIAVWTKN
jgi:hypothetical protein